ncbi:MAG: hypothetical protein MZW92_80575 [Comamonadaceae bacterium]|nr:hypothetical protein [Comamonadaceae bacterium]
MSLFYAAMATLALLLEQGYRSLVLEVVRRRLRPGRDHQHGLLRHRGLGPPAGAAGDRATRSWRAVAARRWRTSCGSTSASSAMSMTAFWSSIRVGSVRQSNPAGRNAARPGRAGGAQRGGVAARAGGAACADSGPPPASGAMLLRLRARRAIAARAPGRGRAATPWCSWRTWAGCRPRRSR